MRLSLFSSFRVRLCIKASQHCKFRIPYLTNDIGSASMKFRTTGLLFWSQEWLPLHHEAALMSSLSSHRKSFFLLYAKICVLIYHWLSGFFCKHSGLLLALILIEQGRHTVTFFRSAKGSKHVLKAQDAQLLQCLIWKSYKMQLTRQQSLNFL